MRRRVGLALLVIIILAASLVGYWKWGSSIKLEKSRNGELSSTIEKSGMNFGMYIDKTELGSSDKGISYEVRNGGTDEVGFGSYYTIERFDGGSWYVVPFKKDIGFNDLLYIVKSGGSSKYVEYLSNSAYNFPDGKYRFIKEFVYGGQKVLLAVEFNISK